MIDWLVEESQNLDIRCGERVIDAAFQHGTWSVTTNQGTYTAETVMNAAGAWADPVAQLFGTGATGTYAAASKCSHFEDRWILLPLRRQVRDPGFSTGCRAVRCGRYKTQRYRYLGDDRGNPSRHGTGYHGDSQRLDRTSNRSV